MSVGTLSKRKARPHSFVEALESRQLLADVTTGFTDSVYISGLTRPTAMTFAPDGRIFVSEQDGHVVIVKGGHLLPTPALTLKVSKAGERGVLGSAVDPNFATNHFFYLYYTALSPAHNRLSRFTVVGDTIDPASEKVLLDLDPLTAAYHNSGALHFGEDGKLYVSVGENTRASLAQNMDSLLGKILRINPDGSIPTDNPFYKTATGQNRLIYDIGLRNPFTFAIEPGTNRLFINDVGEDTWEEVDRDSGHGASNFGWPQSEGPTTQAGITAPLYAYHHNPGTAVVGGVFYPSTGGTFPLKYRGTYIFADHLDGLVQALDPNTGAIVAKISTGGITANADLDIGPDGALYYLERTFVANGGFIGRIQANGAGADKPQITVPPASIHADTGTTALFSVGVTGTPPFSFQWQKNGVDIPGAVDETYSIASLVDGDAGQYRVVVGNDDGDTTSAPATLTVTHNQAPKATIKLPVDGTTYRAGDTITYSGIATDPQDGDLPAANYTWQVDFHHDTHIHPFIAPTPGSRAGTFTIPRIGETSSNTWYEIILYATDSDGNTTITTRDIFPKKSKVVITTNIPGLTLSVDDTPQLAPIHFTGVEHFFRDVEADATQTVGGNTYVFQGWSDGGAAAHTISTPTVDTTYIANYTLAGADGTGVIADYYNNSDFTGTHVQTIEPVINNKWEDGSPDPKISKDTFSARYTGLVRADENATYTFYALADDGVRVWVGGQLIIDQWALTGKATEYTGTIALKAGKKYALRVDYREGTGNAQVELRWSTPDIAKTLVPQTSLYPVASDTPSTIGATISASGDAYVQNGASADTSFGTAAVLNVKQATTVGLLRVAYLKFNLKKVTSVTSAKLRLFGALSDTTQSNVQTQVFASDNTDWDETTTTFNNAPIISGAALATATITNTAPKYYEWDITSYIKAAKAAGHNVVTFVIKNPAFSSNFVAFNSREAGANRPQLVIG